MLKKEQPATTAERMKFLLRLWPPEWDVGLDSEGGAGKADNWLQRSQGAGCAASPPAGGSAALQKCIYQKNKYMAWSGKTC